MNREDLQIVQERHLLDFVSDALDLTPMPVVSHQCPHCGYMVRYPKAVAEGDLQQMATIIRMLEKYAQDRGITAKALADVMAQCHIAIAKRDS